MTIEERAKNIKLLILDVDGVLTDGRIIYGNYGDELKNFNIYDGFGLVLLGRSPIKTVLLTAKKSKIVAKRAKDLDIKHVYQNIDDKLDAYTTILKRFLVSDEEVCFIGDELIDLPVLKKVGLAISVPNAPSEVRDVCHYVTKNHGGKGAVREVIEFLLKTQGFWQALTAKYYGQ